jgi:hypothetical protein
MFKNAVEALCLGIAVAVCNLVDTAGAGKLTLVR